MRCWKNQQAENEKAEGGSYIFIYRDNDGKLIRQSKNLGALKAERVFHVCVRSNGSYVLKENIVRLLRKERLNAHSFRHTHATTLIENGATPKGVAGRLGHVNKAITQNLYTHNTEKLREIKSCGAFLVYRSKLKGLDAFNVETSRRTRILVTFANNYK